MNILRTFKSQKRRKYKNKEPQTSLLVLQKKGCISFINEKANFAMDSCYHYFGNNLTSSFHTN